MSDGRPAPATLGRTLIGARSRGRRGPARRPGWPRRATHRRAGRWRSMHSSVIGKIEKAHRYARELDRITVERMSVTFARRQRHPSREPRGRWLAMQLPLLRVLEDLRSHPRPAADPRRDAAGGGADLALPRRPRGRRRRVHQLTRRPRRHPGIVVAERPRAAVRSLREGGQPVERMRPTAQPVVRAPPPA